MAKTWLGAVVLLLACGLANASGQTTVVEWASDATLNIQAALDRGGTVIVPYVGKVWTVDPLFIRVSGTTLLIRPEVVVEARRGSWGVGDCGLTIRDVSNVTVIGNYATIRGWAAEWSDADVVPHSQWRHGVRVLSSTNVRIEGLLIKNFGGDGIYIGQVANASTPLGIRICRVTCDGNYRNGISITVGGAIVIEYCTFRNARGNNPQAGLGIEPNSSDQQLFGITVSRCLAEGNNGPGFYAWLDRLDKASPRVYVKFVGCVSKNNRKATPMASAKSGLPANSVVGFADCTFFDEPWPHTSELATFSDCKWIQTVHTVCKEVAGEPK